MKHPGIQFTGRHAAGRGFTLIELLVVIAIIAVLAALIIPAVIAAMAEANETSDFASVKGYSNAFTMYHKKYRYFPAKLNMTDSAQAPDLLTVRTNVGGAANLKVLLATGIVEDIKVFFSPRDQAPSQATLDAIMVKLDDYANTAFATSYAYDVGHNVNHGAAVFFGTREEWLVQNPGKPAHVLTAEMNVEKIYPDAGPVPTFKIKNRPGEEMQSVDDNIFDDNIGLSIGATPLGWRDSDLQWNSQLDIGGGASTGGSSTGDTGPPPPPPPPLS